MENTEARVNVTWNGQNGDLPDTVARDANDEDVKRWITEATRGGGIPGILADPMASFRGLRRRSFRRERGAAVQPHPGESGRPVLPDKQCG